MKGKKISTILPEDLLSEAVKIASANQTDTLILALKEFIRSYKRKTVLDLKGKLKIRFDIDQERRRARF